MKIPFNFQHITLISLHSAQKNLRDQETAPDAVEHWL